MGRQLEALHHLNHPLAALAGGQAVQTGEELQVLGWQQVAVERTGLRAQADAHGGARRHRFAADAHLAGTSEKKVPPSTSSGTPKAQSATTTSSKRRAKRAPEKKPGPTSANTDKVMIMAPNAMLPW